VPSRLPSRVQIAETQEAELARRSAPLPRGLIVADEGRLAFAHGAGEALVARSVEAP
jgi:hypothetical protein